MKSFRLAARAVLLFLIVLFIFSSCGYGFLNFSSQTGSLELQFEIKTDNAMSIDRIKYELTPPKGISSTISVDLEGDHAWERVNNMDSGSWQINAELYSGSEVIQIFSYSIEIVTDHVTSFRAEAYWETSEYKIIFETWQYTEGSDGGDNTEGTAAAAEIADFKNMPAVHEYYRTNVQRHGVTSRVLGSNLSDGLKTFSLTYPDGQSFECGSNTEYYSRDIIFSMYADNGLIEVHRNILNIENTMNGNYSLMIADVNGYMTKANESLNYDFASLVPEAVGCNSLPDIPTDITEAGGCSFEYSFTSGVGTRLLYIINRDTGEIYPDPATNGIVMLTDSGSLAYPGAGTMSTGSCELVIAAVEHATLTPYDDALDLGLSPDLLPENLVESLYEIYGENTGYVCFVSASFNFN